VSRKSNAWIIDKLRADLDLVTLLDGDADLVLIAQPYERPPLFEESPAIVVLRSESEMADSESSQAGVRRETIYLEARSQDKGRVHALAERILAVLADAHGVHEPGGSIYRVRHDWSAGPALNPDGKTWESQTRFVVWYR